MDFKNMGESLNNKLWFRIIIIATVSIVLVMFFSKLYPITEAEEGTSLESFTIYLDERITGIMKAYDIPGASIALVKDGEIIFKKAYGYADLEAGRKMTIDTYMRVESISKSVTAWGVMKLFELGKIELDKPVIQYLKSWNFPESEFSEENVTIRQLLSHRAGLPLGDFTKRYSPNQLLPTLKDCLSMEAILEREPGLSFSYSNTGFNLLELLIEEVTGADFAEYMQQEVLIPLGMYNSSFDWSDQLDPPVPFGYDLSGKAIPVYVYPEKGSGGLFATVEDVAIFVAVGMQKSLQNRQVLTSQNINMLYTPLAEELGVYDYVFDSYGLGYYIENLGNGNQAVSHGGQGAGWMTHFHSVPETGDGIVILTNSQRSWPFIAYILSDWTQWGGLPTVGMSKIIWGIYVLWILIGLIWFVILWQVWRLREGLLAKKRRLISQMWDLQIMGIIQCCFFVALVVGLSWCLNQDYLFISSVFPIASKWLGISLFVFSIVLLLSALFPKKG